MAEKQKEKKDTSELVPVYLNDVEMNGKKIVGVKTVIQANFPSYIKVNKEPLPEMFAIKKPNEGCYFSVKIPNDPNTPGEALHINTRFEKGKSNFSVYPVKKYGDKLGRGGFKSKSVNRDSKWKKNLMVEALTGMDMCQDLYESGKIYSEGQKQIIYNLYSDRNDTVRSRIRQSDDCDKKITERAKKTCNEKVKALDLHIIEINDKLPKKRA